MLSKLAFLIAIPVYMCLTYAAGVFFYLRPEERWLWAIVGAGTYAIVLLGVSVLVYRSWLSIQDGRTRVNAPWAVIGLLIPGFGVLWLLVAVFGFSRACNAYIARHDLPMHSLPTWLFLLVVLLLFASFIPNAAFGTVPIAAVLSAILVWLTVDTVNDINHHRRTQALMAQQ